MKNLTLLSVAISFALLSFGQTFETNILPDSLSIYSSLEFCSEGNTAFAVVYGLDYHYLKITNNNYEFIGNVPYTLGYNKTYGMELFDNDCYHLTRDEGVRIYRQDGTWDSLTVNNGLHSGEVCGLYKDNEKLYIITRDTLNYFDGNMWNYFYFNTAYDYVKIQKYNDKVYFFGDIALYTFDGDNLNPIISASQIYSFKIFEDKLYVSFSNNDVSIYNMDGSISSVDLDYPITDKSALCTLGDSLYILYNPHSAYKGVCVKDNEIKQIHHLTKEYDNCKKINQYKNGILSWSPDRKLIYINASNYDDFASLQLDKTYRNLDINQVDAYYMHRGQMFWDAAGTAKYEVPKGSGKTSLFAGGLWLSAKDDSDKVHLAAVKFNTEGYDYFPGPLRATGSNKGTTDTSYARNFDHIWKITREEILLHQLFFDDPNYQIPDDILTWPAHGNVSDGYAENLAPFIDVNANGIYEPEQGDYPDIKGDMSLYWIYNDNLAKHSETHSYTTNSSSALGVEVHAQAYAYTCDTLQGLDSILNYTTFLDYTIINRSDTNYHNFSTGFWTDADVGYEYDDYVGSNVGLNSMYFYNGTEMDGNGDGQTYGANPPAQFITLLNAPFAEANDNIDNDNDGTIDEADEKALMANMIYFNNDNSNNGDPIFAEQYYNYMHELWKDNRPLIFGGTGYSPTGGIPAKYMFPGESDPWMNGTYGIDPNYPDSLPGGWTEANEGNAPYDRRGVISSGPVNLNSGDELNFTFAFVWSRGDNGPMSSVTKGFGDVARITEMFDNGELHGCGLEDVSVNNVTQQKSLEIYPNPVEESFIVKGTKQNSKYKIIDTKGQLVKEGVLNEKSININNLKKGAYIVKIISKNKTTSLKLIKN